MRLYINVVSGVLTTKEHGVIEDDRAYRIDDNHSFVVIRPWDSKYQFAVKILRDGRKRAIRRERIYLLSERAGSSEMGTYKQMYAVDLSPERTTKAFPFVPVIQTLRKLGIRGKQISPMSGTLSEYFSAGSRSKVHTDGELHILGTGSREPTYITVTNARWVILSSNYRIVHVYLWAGSETAEQIAALRQKIERIQRST